MTEINTDEVYKKIKKHNGEGVARVIRDAVLLDVPNIVHILEFAGNNPDEAEQLVPVIREIYKEKVQSEYHTDKTPLELLSDAGYDAFVVETLEQQNSIQKYYRPGEELCTFRDPTRYENYYMIHAVKRGADKIQPSDHPERQDEYGTSVISIQIAKTGGFISIKNRYNHTVNNPDATFNSNPDNIIPGLSESLKKYFGVDFNFSTYTLPDHFRMVNDQLVRYNHERNNMYFGPDYYFSGSTITKLNKDYELMLDVFVLNTKNGELRSPDEMNEVDSIFTKLFKDKKIKVENNPDNKKEKIIYTDGVRSMAVCDGQIIEFNLPGLRYADMGFFKFNTQLRSISLPDLEHTGQSFLANNQCLTEISFPKLKIVEDNFCPNNHVIKKVYLPELEEVGMAFLAGNEALTEISLPKLKKVGSEFLRSNEKIHSVNFPELQSTYSYFMDANTELTELIAPNLSEVWGKGFLRHNTKLCKIQLSPNLRQICEDFLSKNTALTHIDLPNVVAIEDNFLHDNNCITEIDLPSVIEIGDNFLSNNVILRSINAPNLKRAGKDFLTGNRELTELNFPKLESVGQYSLQCNHKLVSIDCPKAERLGELSTDQPDLKYFNMPSLSPERQEFWMRYNTVAAFSLAKDHVREIIDKETNAAKEQIATISKKHQANNE